MREYAIHNKIMHWTGILIILLAVAMVVFFPQLNARGLMSWYVVGLFASMLLWLFNMPSARKYYELEMSKKHRALIYPGEHEGRIMLEIQEQVKEWMFKDKVWKTTCCCTSSQSAEKKDEFLQSMIDEYRRDEPDFEVIDMYPEFDHGLK